jgi:drug/metabolite transporter (DMT)-like permease
MLAIVAAVLIISIAGAFKVSDVTNETYSNITTSPAWIPVLFGLITPLSFTSNGILTKHLTSKEVNFNASTISFSSFALVNVIIMIFAVIYWMSNPFSS